MAFSSTAPRAEDTFENAFGPVSHRRPFDFTITFEQAILSIIPSTFLLLAGLPRLLHLSRRQRKTRSGHNYFLKLVRYISHLIFPINWAATDERVGCRLNQFRPSTIPSGAMERISCFADVD